MPDVSVLICDLDNTLFDSRSIPFNVMAPVHAALRAVNAGPRALSLEALEGAIVASATRSFDDVVREYQLTPAHVRAWCAAHAPLTVHAPLVPYDDVDVLSDLPLTRFLVTTGFRAFQESKIAALGLEALFEARYIDALDDPHRLGKRALFERIMTEQRVHPSEVVVLGDSAESELAAGADLGMVTVQILRAGVRPAPNAQFRIASLGELRDILREVHRKRG